MNNYKVLITTAGLGERLGLLTKFTNKALIRVGKKPALSYIIEAYPSDVPLVIVIGHFGDHIKEFVELAYPERKNIEFIRVDKYEGEGSSLGYSMLAAKNRLQCPFIFHASDTIVLHPIPRPEKNWIGGYNGCDVHSTHYASWQVVDEFTLALSEKGALDFDYLHIGIVGIRDYNQFWEILERLYRENPNDKNLNDCRVIFEMIKRKIPFEIVNFPVWYDTGNVEALHRARRGMLDNSHNLEKVDESVFIFDKFVIKFFADQGIVSDRIARAKLLKGFVPYIEGNTKNFYRYKFVPGAVYSRVVTPSDFKNFLRWLDSNLWKKTQEVSKEEFKKVCREFYEIKTKERVAKFIEVNSVSDESHMINGEEVPSIAEMLKMVDFDYLATTEQYQFHGDLILDNVIKTNGGYCLVDWRQGFGKLLGVGDIYYDLAKLNHNLVVNHDIVNDNGFSVKIAGDSIICDILRKDNLVRCQEVLYDFIRGKGWDLKKVELLTPIIWLNMAPLHPHPFSSFLYYFGKLNLWRVLQKNK
jgi:NDP-sugar pyrophosphorylase family protein